MRTSETIASLAKALAKAQSEISDPAMSGKAQVGGGKSAARHYPYALLTDVLLVARKALGANGVFFTQAVDIDRNVMVTRLIHSSGEWMEFDYPMAPRQSDPQKQGSANTYARRYSLMSILGVAGEADDDGAGAKSRSKSEDDTEAAHKAGADAGRRWAVAQMLLPSRDGYSGAGFAKQVKDAGISHTLEHIKLYSIWLGKDKPSRQKAGDRDGLVHYLATVQGATSWEKFVKECGPLPKVKKRKKAEPVPEGAAGVVPPRTSLADREISQSGKWTDAERDAFLSRIGEIDWPWVEVAAWCIDNKRGSPADMGEERRQKLLEWLVKDVDGTNGGDTIMAWVNAQGEE